MYAASLYGQVVYGVPDKDTLYRILMDNLPGRPRQPLLLRCPDEEEGTFTLYAIGTTIGLELFIGGWGNYDTTYALLLVRPDEPSVADVVRAWNSKQEVKLFFFGD